MNIKVAEVFKKLEYIAMKHAETLSEEGYTVKFRIDDFTNDLSDTKCSYSVEILPQ